MVAAELKMRTHVISTTGARERRAAISRHLDDIGFCFRFFDAVDGRTVESVKAHYICKPDFPERSCTFRERSVDHGELACTLSHMMAIRQAWQRGAAAAGPLLILEDDALFCSNDRALLGGLLAQVPADAAYVQFGLTPTSTITQLGEYFRQGGGLHVAKTSPISMALDGSILACHCTAGYIITTIGMRAISERWFEGDQVIFPCDAGEIAHNVALVADRLVYQAAVSQGGVGYVCAVPIVTTVAVESILHPDHVPWHQEARDAALKWFEALRPMLLASCRRHPPAVGTNEG